MTTPTPPRRDNLSHRMGHRGEQFIVVRKESGKEIYREKISGPETVRTNTVALSLRTFTLVDAGLQGPGVLEEFAQRPRLRSRRPSRFPARFPPIWRQSH
jgi:hypothetical protein